MVAAAQQLEPCARPEGAGSACTSGMCARLDCMPGQAERAEPQVCGVTPARLEACAIRGAVQGCPSSHQGLMCCAPACKEQPISWFGWHCLSSWPPSVCQLLRLLLSASGSSGAGLLPHHPLLHPALPQPAFHTAKCGAACTSCWLAGQTGCNQNMAGSCRLGAGLPSR